MTIDYDLFERLLSEPRTAEAEMQLVQSIEQIKPIHWLEILELNANLTILVLPNRPVFVAAVRTPRHDAEDAIAHLVLFDEHETVVSAVEAGLQYIAARPTVSHLSGILAALLAVLDQEIGVNLLQSKKDWFPLSDDIQEAHFRSEIREGLRAYGKRRK